MMVKSKRRNASQNTFIPFVRNLINQLNQVGRQRTAEKYFTTLNSLLRFLRGKEISWKDMDASLMMAYEQHLREAGICPNTSSFYLRNLRAIYNRGVELGLTSQQYPFRQVYTGIERTAKRAVPIQVIRRLHDLDLSCQPVMDWARDMFLFSFYTRGMSFIDMAYLQKKDLQYGILSYRRKKTGQLLYIKWEGPMQKIIDKYDTRQSPYLLPIIKYRNKDERRQYINAAHLINNKLKIIGGQIGLSIPLTMYVARHGWATIAKNSHIPLSTISEALGHDSEKTTRIYLASLDTSVIDNANKKILNLI